MTSVILTCDFSRGSVKNDIVLDFWFNLKSVNISYIKNDFMYFIRSFKLPKYLYYDYRNKLFTFYAKSDYTIYLTNLKFNDNLYWDIDDDNITNDDIYTIKQLLLYLQNNIDYIFSRELSHSIKLLECIYQDIDSNPELIDYINITDEYIPIFIKYNNVIKHYSRKDSVQNGLNLLESIILARD